MNIKAVGENIELLLPQVEKTLPLPLVIAAGALCPCHDRIEDAGPSVVQIFWVFWGIFATSYF